MATEQTENAKNTSVNRVTNRLTPWLCSRFRDVIFKLLELAIRQSEPYYRGTIVAMAWENQEILRGHVSDFLEVNVRKF